MDDLDYSVFIAERDWESFYEESEECSIQQAWLASLDDSGFSDTDDEKKSTQGPDLDLQIKADIPNKEPNAATLTKSEADDYIAGTLLESLSNKTDNDRSPKHTAEINLNDVSTTHACLTSDSSVAVTICANQQLTDSNIEDFSEHNENHIKDKSCQAVGEPNTSFSCIQNSSHVGRLEEKTVLKVSEISATPNKEKERWFVTVNDSPIKPRVQSGQKKVRKKKPSRKLVGHSLETERQCPVSNNNNNNNKEDKEVKKDGQILQNEFVQPSKTCSEHVLSPTKEPEITALEKSSVPEMNCTSEALLFNAKEEKTSCVFNFKCKANSDHPTEALTNNPLVSVNSLSPSNLTDSPQLQTNAVVNEQTMHAATPDHLMGINSNHKAQEDTQPGGSTLTREATITLENLQESPTQMPQALEVYSQETQDQGSQKESLEAAVGPKCPVYALSSFWDEMEKLTINDILHLRTVHNRSPTSRSVISDESDVHLEHCRLLTSKHDSLQESGLMEDSADSDYFTHVDESKPDRSSCELSVFSDCDDSSENSCSELQYVKEQTESLMSTYIPGHECDSNIETESLDIIKLSHQDGIPPYLYPAIVSFGDTVDHSSTFSEILAEDINGATSSDRLSSTAVSCPFTQNLFVCEMYDDFSDFETENLLFLSPQDMTVPIFNASRSVVRDMLLPHMGELDFNPVFEQVNRPIRDLTHIGNQTEMSTSPLGVPNLCFFMSQRGNWSSLFSLRRVRFIGKGSTWHHKASSWMFPKEAKKEAAYISRAQQLTPLMEAGNKSFLQLAELQQHVFIPKKDTFIFSMKQADMCLVCIAFASWVLKSSNTPSTDTWKTALLANISAISAIQYLRKYEKGHS